MMKAQDIYRLGWGVIAMLLLCAMRPAPSLAGEGLVLTAASSPAISIGVEKAHIGIYAGTGFRWSKYQQFSDSALQFGDPLDISESVVVLSPTVTLNWLNDARSIPWYLALRAQKDVVVSASASGFDSSTIPYSNADQEEYLKSQHSPWIFSGGVGVRAPLTERLSLGGEVGVSYFFVDPKIESDSYIRDTKNQSVSTFFRLTMFLYL